MPDNRTPSTEKVLEVIKNPDGTVTTKVWPSPGVVAVAELLRRDYLSQYETDAPVSEWFPSAIEIVGAYLEAEGEA